MKNIINERLKIISAYILDNEKIIDIGCDHALLDIYLSMKRENLRIIASDININPLMKAKENVLKYHMEDKIKLKQANGLAAIEKDINTVIISGMGAISIINILKDINKYPNVSKLVLSPNNDFPLLRNEISKLGFKIVKEEIVKEKNKYYLVCEFKKGTEAIDSFFGKLDLEKSINKEYFMYLYNRNSKIIEKIANNSLKKQKLQEENMNIKKKIKIV